MTRKFVALLILSCFWLWVGCAVVIIGAGVGAGTYTYIKGDLKRAYNAKFDKTHECMFEHFNRSRSTDS